MFGEGEVVSGRSFEMGEIIFGWKGFFSEKSKGEWRVEEIVVWRCVELFEGESVEYGCR